MKIDHKSRGNLELWHFKISPNSYCQIVLYRVYRLHSIIETFCQYGFQNKRCQPKMSIRWWFRLHGYFDAV